MKKFIMTVVLLLLTASLLPAGVVFEMASKDLPSGKEGETSTIQAQDGKVRVDSTKKTSVIFSNDVMWIINHEKKSVIKMDQESMDRLGERMSAATKQMDEQLAKLPPEQREMMEKMMKGALAKSIPQKSLPVRVEAAGSGNWGSYSCNKYNMYVGEEKTEEICAASPDQLEGADEAMESFLAMAEFSKQLMESLQKGPLGEMIGNAVQNPLQDLQQINGVPVHTIHFENGKPVREQTLKSSSHRNLDASVFTPPADYKVQNPFQGK